MGQRNEQRVAVSLDVIVRGVESHGNSFEVSAITHDISCSGACITGLTVPLTAGNKVQIDHKNQRAWYRVQWVSKGADGKQRAGVRCLEPGTYIWGLPLKGWEPDSYDPSQVDSPLPEPIVITAMQTATDWSGADRRQFPRRSCRIEAQVTTDQGSVRLPATVTDISLGGCYMEMLAPLPVNTTIELLLKLSEGGSLQMSGQVRSSQTGLGMGIAFTGMRPKDFEQLQRLAPAPAKQVSKTPQGREAAQSRPNAKPTTTPQRPGPLREPDAGNVPTTPEAFQAMVRLLLRKGILTRAELLEELESLKTTR